MINPDLVIPEQFRRTPGEPARHRGVTRRGAYGATDLARPGYKPTEPQQKPTDDKERRQE